VDGDRLGEGSQEALSSMSITSRGGGERRLELSQASGAPGDGDSAVLLQVQMSGGC
jgi:hypothetical protein